MNDVRCASDPSGNDRPAGHPDVSGRQTCENQCTVDGLGAGRQFARRNDSGSESTLNAYVRDVHEIPFDYEKYFPGSYYRGSELWAFAYLFKKPISKF